MNGQMLTVTPFLWIQHPVGEAANFYAGLFDDGEIVSGPDVGDEMSSATVRFSGQTIHLFNAGSQRECASPCRAATDKRRQACGIRRFPAG